MLLGSGYMTTSSPYTSEVDNGSLQEVFPQHDCHIMQAFTSTRRNNPVTNNFCQESYPEGCSVSPSRSPGSVLATESLANNDTYLAEMAIWQGNENFLCPSSPSFNFLSSNIGFRVSRKGRLGSRWFKLRAALKWGISIRRDAAAKRIARFLDCDI